MLGMIKWSALNIVRHTPEIISPEILLVWSFSRSQLSAKIAVNMAVSTKSNPLRSQRCPNNPIGFIEPGNPEQIPSSVGSFRNLGSTSQGKGLARHAEDQEEFLPSQSFIFFEHREPIKQMSCIHHQYHQEGL